MAVSIDDIKKLKELTGVGLTDAKAALVAADGDFDKALEEMRKKGLTKAEKKADREALEGVIDSYVHGGRIGVLVEVNCETDFVARTDGFKEFAHMIALQVASMSPVYVTEEEIPADEIARVRKEAAASGSNKGKPADIAEKIIEGQVKKYFAEKVLLNQQYIMDDSMTVGTFLKQTIGQVGENIVIRRFKRIELGVND
ncbi:MAG: translation elongation factor Ts [Candidatus Microsaccharimonas sossegonensis]|uniref:Elongation factor Ts n=1 Tax=Candidatus Microsaccharimonas sossegonensis TaxID=2506948 RepID=A0A4Q0AHS6_9BACT|nr:MAG: translation elongation factor Ts [Candidatus Microsaccharimonas sossegonensis]